MSKYRQLTYTMFMRVTVLIICFLCLISIVNGQSIKLDTNKVYTLNTIIKSPLAIENNIALPQNFMLIDKESSVNTNNFKYSRYKLNSSDFFFGYAGYLGTMAYLLF